jgi:hypothetical protein
MQLQVVNNTLKMIPLVAFEEYSTFGTRSLTAYLTHNSVFDSWAVTNSICKASLIRGLLYFPVICHIPHLSYAFLVPIHIL